MRLPPHLSITNHRLAIGGVDCDELASRYGTPLYVTDEDRILNRFAAWKKALTSRYPDSRVLYAAKANGNLCILRALASAGAGADVFSAGELFLALDAGMPPELLLFNGSSKSPSDLALAVENGVKVSVDSLDELAQLDAVAGEAGKSALISFRVNPALEVPTHPKIATGLATSKFGIPHERIPDAYHDALSREHVLPVGLHCHIGSQILDVEPFARAASVMMRIAATLSDMGVRLSFIDLGGGLGIPYRHDTDPVPGPDDYADLVVPIFTEGLKALSTRPDLWVEPGRSLVGDSTVLLSRVNSVKHAHKQFVNIDAGFNLLVRPVMYEAYHEVLLAGKADFPPNDVYTVTGPICESGDIIAADRRLPEVAAGDLVAILDAGAYGFAMSSQYNSRPRCAELVVKGGMTAVMRRAETLDDLVATMRRPPWQR